MGVCKNDGPLKTVVASTFREIVLDETKDVLLAVVAQPELLLSAC